MKCPHCNETYSLNVRVFLNQTCEKCGKKLYKDISKKYSTIKWIGRFLAILPIFLYLGDSAIINLGMLAVSFVLYIIVELICMKIAPFLK